MAIISFSEIKSKLITVSQEMLGIVLSFIKENTTPIASANTFTLFHSELSAGDLTQGRYYEILDASGGADFTGVGAADNVVGTQFKANSASLTPTWGAGSLAVAQWDGNTITVSGTTTINTISKKFINYGDRIRLIFTGALQLTDSAGTSGDDCELVLGANVNTIAGNEAELQLRNDNKWYCVGGSIAGIGGSSLWERLSGFTKLINTEQIQLSKMLQVGQSANIASANILTLPANGNYVNISDNVNELQLISNLDSDGKLIQGGTEYIIDVPEDFDIKHLFTASGNGKRIRLDSKQDFTSPGNLYKIVYDSIDDWWEMAGTSMGDLISEITNIYAVPENAAMYDLTGGGLIVGWTTSALATYTVENTITGGAAVDIIDDEHILVGTGDIGLIIVKDASDNIIHSFGCNENNTSSFAIVDSVTQDIFFVTGTKTADVQDEVFEAEKYGVTLREDDDNPGTFMQINYSNTKVKTEIG